MGEKQLIIVLVLFNVVLITFIIGIALFIKQYRIKKALHTRQLREIDEHHKKELLQTQVEIQHQTMKSIGREIHDNVGQKLTLASLYLNSTNFHNSSDEVITTAKNVKNLIQDSLKDLRKLSKSLTDDRLNNSSLEELLQREVEIVNQFEKVQVDFQHQGLVRIHSYTKKAILLRVVQEFIQNSLKHSECDQIQIHLQEKDNTITLDIADNGKGFNLNQMNQGIGLKNMQNRVQMVNGTFQLKSTPGKGTELQVQIT